MADAAKRSTGKTARSQTTCRLRPCFAPGHAKLSIIPLFPPQAAHDPEQLLHIEAAVLRRLFGRRRWRRGPGGWRWRRQGHPQAAGELLRESGRQQGPHRAHILLHADSAPLGPDLLSKDQSAGQGMGRRRRRPRRAIGSILVHISVHTYSLCASLLPCHPGIGSAHVA